MSIDYFLLIVMFVVLFFAILFPPIVIFLRQRKKRQQEKRTYQESYNVLASVFEDAKAELGKALLPTILSTLEILIDLAKSPHPVNTDVVGCAPNMPPIPKRSGGYESDD